MKHYATREETIQREIVEPIEASGIVVDAYAEYDVDAIADRVLGTYEDGYRSRFDHEECCVDHEDFWEIVSEHDTTDISAEAESSSNPC